MIRRVFFWSTKTFKAAGEEPQKIIPWFMTDCTCENRCVNCFKLQSELNEVKMELKSVKEIVNILSRDLASVSVRVHNLHEHESSHIVMQPFKRWPSRLSTKKTYSKVTVCETYAVTKNRFHLLDNHHENDSPVDVLNKKFAAWEGLQQC